MIAYKHKQPFMCYLLYYKGLNGEKEETEFELEEEFETAEEGVFML